MSIIPTNTDANVRELQLDRASARQLALAENRITQLEDSTIDQTPEPDTTTQNIPMVNLIRNGDHNFNMNCWFQSAPSGNDTEHECANVYAHAPDESVRVTDGEIDAMDAVLTSATAAFVLGDVGKRIIVYGAGAGDANLVTTIFQYNSATEVELADPADTTVTGATVRFRLSKLGKTNHITNPGTTVTDSLKHADHTDYASNITDPDWDKDSGHVRLGSTNRLSYPFGYYNAAGTTFIPLNPLFAGRDVYSRVQVARASEYVKPKGRFYFSIYNNDDGALEHVESTPFTITGGTTDATPAATTTAQYMVVIVTDQGYSIVSEVLTIADSPDENSFTANCFNFLTWARFPGALNYLVYRKLGSGNVFLLEEENPQATYTDTNPALRIDTGVTTFPNPTDAQAAVRSYVSTSEGDFDDLPVDGVDDEWLSLLVAIPYPKQRSVAVSDPILILGQTEPCSLEVADVVTNSTTTVTSAAAQFAAFMTGLSFTLTKADGSQSVSGTVTYVSATELTLSTPATWTGTNAVLEIEAGAPNGLLLDLTSAAFQSGEWSPHVEDRTGRPQTGVSNPNESSQGGIGGGGGVGGEVIGCVLDSVIVETEGANGKIIEMEAGLVKRKMRLFFGEYDAEGKPVFNTVKRRPKRHKVREITLVETSYGTIPVSKTHRWSNCRETNLRGFPTSELTTDNFLLYFDGKSDIIATVRGVRVVKGDFTVIEFELEGDDPETEHLFLANKHKSHNTKDLT